MPRRLPSHTTTLEERLVDLARRVRSEVETLAPCSERDELVQKLRKIETALDINQVLWSSGSARESGPPEGPKKRPQPRGEDNWDRSPARD